VEAPIAGVIEQKSLDVFDTVSAQSPAYVISDKNALTVAFEVAESALDYLNIGDTVTVEKNGETCPGTISEISTSAGAQSGLYAVEATVQNAAFELRSGSSVKLFADVQKLENGMVVPIDAVYYENGVPYVFLFQSNTAKRADVELGISDAEMIHVISGLSPTDEIIVTYSANLFDGAEVYLPGTAPETETAPTESGEAGA
jgi:RND family efflux transporter MFP subunit